MNAQKITERASTFGQKTAIIDKNGAHSYEKLQLRSSSISLAISNELGSRDLNGMPICFLVPSSFDYAATLWGIWKSGAMAVPLSVSHPVAELEYVLNDTESPLLIYHADFAEKVVALSQIVNIRLLPLEKIKEKVFGKTENELPDYALTDKALMIYTSGTTGKPKGAVSTHANLVSQIEMLGLAWHWGTDDFILNVLPLHHVHGLTNILLCALWNGATCQLEETFDAAEVWNQFKENSFSVLMAVPTVYSKLIRHFEEIEVSEQENLKSACQSFRLMVSGSAALPVGILEKWKSISGHTLLERYGMTEIGMALSNPYSEERKAGTVGFPLPNVRTLVVDEEGLEIEEGEVGELWIKSPNVFLEYWRKPQATAEAFTEEGWFKTGDSVKIENGYYCIMGRNSVDILKSSGYKISALEIEEVLRQHENVRECAVVGLPHEEYGQTVAAAVIAEVPISLEGLQKWLSERLAPYKIPRKLLVVNQLPRNAMGKVVKPEIVKLF